MMKTYDINLITFAPKPFRIMKNGPWVTQLAPVVNPEARDVVKWLEENQINHMLVKERDETGKEWLRGSGTAELDDVMFIYAKLKWPGVFVEPIEF